MKLTKKSLAEFLKVSPNRRFRVMSDLKCPVAGYFHACGVKDACVPGDGYVRSNSGHYTLPRWAGKFIAAVDNQATKTITGKRALEILQGIGKGGKKNGNS